VFLERLERVRGNSVVRWVRDVTFAEDLSQVRTGSASQIMASLRNLAISLHRLAPPTSPPR
jgi:predicted transposase YbfD/YdcC